MFIRTDDTERLGVLSDSRNVDRLLAFGGVIIAFASVIFLLLWG